MHKEVGLAGLIRRMLFEAIGAVPEWGRWMTWLCLKRCLPSEEVSQNGFLVVERCSNVFQFRNRREVSMRIRVVGGCLVVLGVVFGTANWFFSQKLWMLLGRDAHSLSSRNDFIDFLVGMGVSAVFVVAGVLLLRWRR